ncbi:hypothetical protein V5799_018376 [Amblyomma americanum]|uniref:C2H2-type domain-containing protein n=1 Tax=Amblyomma americanum TaxID=6943 RepID=A0AAQ4F0P7_AMBAM
MIIYANMEGERPLNGDLPSFVPVETILKEDGSPISVDTDKPGSLMMNLETRELFLSNDAASPQQQQQQQQHQQQPQQQQFALSANEKSPNLAKDMDVGAKQWDCNLCSPLLKKALQRERLQALRQNPSYREMERLRQRSMMQLKRQDPSFRALERERQRARMQLRRQDPSFRAMERERQRRRMRLKRRDPAFREREREQQKSRLLVKRSADKLPMALDASSSSSSALTATSTSIVSSQSSSQLALPPPPHHQALPLQSHMPHPSSSHPQSQQPPSSQQHGKGAPLGNCLMPHEMQKQRDATALYGHLQRIVGYHNLLQGRPHPEDPGSSFKSPYFAGEPSGSLVGRRMGGPQGHHGGSSKAVVPVGGGRQKSFLDGGPCHPLGEVFAASYPTMRDQGLSSAGAQPCGALDGPPLLHAATSADGGRNSHPALLGSGADMLPSVPDCPECLEAQRQRSQCGLCQGEEQQAMGPSGRSSGRRRSSRQSTERFRCTVCAKEFGMKHHLKEHYKSHGDRNLCCPHCDYRTCYGYALRRHVIIRHDRPAARQAQVIQQLTVQ